jgi:hypothetical protein
MAVASKLHPRRGSRRASEAQSSRRNADGDHPPQYLIICLSLIKPAGSEIRTNSYTVAAHFCDMPAETVRRGPVFVVARDGAFAIAISAADAKTPARGCKPDCAEPTRHVG